MLSSHAAVGRTTPIRVKVFDSLDRANGSVSIGDVDRLSISFWDVESVQRLRVKLEELEQLMDAWTPANDPRSAA